MNIKKAFSNSLLSLLYKKPLSKITIGDLLEDTELSRQTFYNHFLDKNDALFYEGQKRIADMTLVALTIMIAESRPEEKEMMISLVMNCIA